MKKSIYLAGGFKSAWQREVWQRLDSNFTIYDPKEKEYTNGERIKMSLEEYGTWDLHHIRLSDIVFVYLEKTNPGCVGALVEAGYAKGLGKTVITVLEPNHETIEDRYLQFVKLVSDVTFETLQDGIAFLSSLHDE